VHALEHKLIIATIVLVCFALATLRGHRKVITIPRYVAIVVSAAVWGMYLGRAEVLYHWIQ
jgi:hypothetical protein